MTAFVIPNAIQITTRNAKYTFASFLARDTVYDVIYNIWRLSRPEDIVPDEGGRNGLDGHDLPSIGSVGGLPVGGELSATMNGAARALARKATRCECGKQGKHFTELAMDVVFPGTPEQIYNLMFASGFMKDFMREDQKLESASFPCSFLPFLANTSRCMCNRPSNLGLGTCLRRPEISLS